MIRNILMVCVGNICRSPMAEGLLKQQAVGHEGVRIHSAGLGALVGSAADPEALTQMAQRGVDIAQHRARQISLEIVRDVDLILVMEKPHLQHLHAQFPVTRGKVHLLGKWNEREIPDPYRKSPEFFANTAKLIEEGVAAWAARIWR